MVNTKRQPRHDQPQRGVGVHDRLLLLVELSHFFLAFRGGHGSDFVRCPGIAHLLNERRPALWLFNA